MRNSDFSEFFSCLLQQKFFLPERRLWYVMKKNKKSREFYQFLSTIKKLSKKILILSKKIWHCQRNLYIAIRILFFYQRIYSFDPKISWQNLMNYKKDWSHFLNKILNRKDLPSEKSQMRSELLILKPF